jgi:hypothetical protein
VVKVLSSRDPVLPLHSLPVDTECEILRHDSIAVDGIDTACLEVASELDETLVLVPLAREYQSSRPGKDGGDRVGRGLSALMSYRRQ